MRKLLLGFLIFALFEWCNACKRKNREPEPDVIGMLAVNLDANEQVVRRKEALIGNMITDAIKSDFDSKGKAVSFVLLNSGSIRFSNSKRSNGIYPAGDFTSNMADEMLPFGNATVIVTVSGKQLKEILERSVAQYPLAKGNFMQLSGEVKILVDTTQQPQVLNIEETTIVTPGNRIVSIKINNVEYDNVTQYKVVVPDFIAEGNDGYATLRKLSPALKDHAGDDMASVLKEYVIINSVVEPKLQGRIAFQ
jgi:2',3'-cyclic-nucleotide 2'-phosphodiesterase (5'-nucleotidase family)